MNSPLAVSTTSSAFMAGVLCAYWAQTTRRNPWLWFAFGFLLAPIAGVVLLWKNANDHPMSRDLDDRGRADLLATHKDVI
ncbi:MAG: hypothetical protein EPO46_06400 [Lysobacter sp.]|nr:MAG: hypothetical protein EPO46_06400 [Lysobacter sp.]